MTTSALSRHPSDAARISNLQSERRKTMSKPHGKSFYAIKGEKSVHISEVERGLACGCICGECKDRLIAKKGIVKAHHFAHEANHSCQSKGESAIHLRAKEVIEKERRILLPAVEIEFASYVLEPLIVRPEAILSLSNIQLESPEGDFRPDISACAKGHKLFIEPAYSHFIDEDKKAKIKKRGVSTVEIDLRGLDSASPQEIERAVIQDAPRKWIYSKAADLREKQILSHATLRDAPYPRCPKPPHARYNPKYSTAYIIKDCLYCTYFLKHVHDPDEPDNEGIFCGPVRPGAPEVI